MQLFTRPLKQVLTLTLALLCSVPAAQAGALYITQSGVLTVPSVNVPGLGALQAQLTSTSSDTTLRVGTVLQVQSEATAGNPAEVPASYTFYDQVVVIPALAVRGVDGSLRYFDVKLRSVNGNNSSFVVDSMEDTKLGRSTAGVAGPQGDMAHRELPEPQVLPDPWGHREFPEPRVLPEPWGRREFPEFPEFPDPQGLPDPQDRRGLPDPQDRRGLPDPQDRRGLPAPPARWDRPVVVCPNTHIYTTRQLKRWPSNQRSILTAMA